MVHTQRKVKRFAFIGAGSSKRKTRTSENHDDVMEDKQFCLFEVELLSDALPANDLDFEEVRIVPAKSKLGRGSILFVFSEIGRPPVNKKICHLVRLWHYLFPYSGIYKFFPNDGMGQAYLRGSVSQKYIDEIRQTGEFDFNNLGPDSTGLPVKNISFEEVFDRFSQLDAKGQHLFALFAHATGERDPLYENSLQTIASLQTVFESISKSFFKSISRKIRKEILKKNRDKFLLTQKHFSDDEIRFFLKLKSEFSSAARNMFVHEGHYLNSFDKLVNYHINNEGTEPLNSRDIRALIDREIGEWSGADWFLAEREYVGLMRRLLWVEYLDPRV